MANRRVQLPEGLDLSVEQILDLEPEAQVEYIRLLQEHTARHPQWLWTPQQQQLHLSCMEADENLGGGAAGGGKSWFLMHHAKWLAENWRGARIGVFRRMFPELRSTLIPLSLRICRMEDGWKWRAQDKEWHLKHADGRISVIQFGHARNADDVRTYDSTEFAAILIDELAEWEEDMWTFLVGRLRITVEQEDEGWHPHMCGTTNPGGVGHAWMKRRFVNPTGHGDYIAHVLAEPNVPESEYTVSYTPFGVTDNPHVAKSYVKSLWRLKPVLRRQRMYGDWSATEGTAFPEFSAQTHVQHFDVDPEIRHRASGDYGYTDPTFILWGAQGYDGQIFVYREWQGNELIPAEIARRYIDLSAQPVGPDHNRVVPTIERFVWDTQIWSKTPGGDRIIDRFRKGGMTGVLARAYKERVPGWLQVHEYMQPADYAEHEDPQSCVLPPRLFIHPTCTTLITAIEDARTDPHNPEDVVAPFDHPLDALRYLICDFAHLSPPTPRTDDPLDALPEGSMVRRLAEMHRREPRRKARRSRNYPGVTTP